MEFGLGLVSMIIRYDCDVLCQQESWENEQKQEESHLKKQRLQNRIEEICQVENKTYKNENAIA